MHGSILVDHVCACLFIAHQTAFMHATLVQMNYLHKKRMERISRGRMYYVWYGDAYAGAYPVFFAVHAVQY